MKDILQVKLRSRTPGLSGRVEGRQSGTVCACHGILPVFVARAPEITEAIRSVIQINPFGTLVETFPAEQSKKVMAICKKLITEIVREYGDPEIDNILYEAIVLGLLDGFVRECPYVLPVLIPAVTLVQS